MSIRFKRSVSSIAAATLLASSLPAPAYASAFNVAMPLADRERVEMLLINYGVQPVEARARAAALTDAEAGQLAAEINTLPAGGTGVDALLWFGFVIVVASLALIGKAVETVANEISRSRSASVHQNSGAQEARSTGFQER